MKKHSKLRHRFYWQLPRNWRDLLKPNADKNFRQQHKFLYITLTILAIIFLFGFFILYAIILIHVNKNVFGPLAGIGALGSILLGAAFCNIICAFVGEYFGHYVTLILFFSGLFISGISIYIASLI